MTPTAAPLQSEQRHGAKKQNPAFSQSGALSGDATSPAEGYLITNYLASKQRQWQRQQRCQQQPWQRQQQERRRQKQQEQLRKQLGLQERLQQQELEQLREQVLVRVLLFTQAARAAAAIRRPERRSSSFQIS